jgi:hypothetical protein
MSSWRRYILVSVGLWGLVGCTAEPVGGTSPVEDTPPVANTPPARPEPTENRCTPRTCEQVGADCGSLADGCGGTLQCGTCLADHTCGGAGLPNVCSAHTDSGSVEWLRTFPRIVSGLATDPRGDIFLLYQTGDGAALSRVDQGGQFLWSQPGFSSFVSLSGLSVAPTTGKLYTWGWRYDESGPGGAIAYGFDASGTQPRVIGQCGDECGLGPYFEDAAGNRLESHRTSNGSGVYYSRPDGTGWSLQHWASFPSQSPTPFSYAEAVFDSEGQVLVAASLEGKATFQGRTFGAEGQIALVVLKFSSQGQLRWAREFPVTHGRLAQLGVSSSGRVVVQGEFLGSLTWPGGVLTASKTGDGFLMSLDADGKSEWIQLLPPNPYHRYMLAVAPSGRSAVISERMDPTTPHRTLMHARVYDPEGNVRWSQTWPSAESSGRVSFRGVAWSGQELVLGGNFNGTVDFGTGIQQAPLDPYQPMGFVLKLRAP